MKMRPIALAMLLLLAASALAPVVPSWSNGKSTQEQPGPANNVALSDGETVTMTVSVLEDESTMSGEPDTNQAGNQNGGGLWVGHELIDGMTRSWLKFNLSHIPDNAAIQSATLNSYLNDEWVPESDAAIGAYYSTNDTWSTETITWNNQPDFSATPSDVIDSPASPDMFVMGNWYHWDVSGAVAETIQGDKILTEVLKQVDEGLTNETWKYFLDKDHLADYPFNDTYLALQYVTPATDGLAVDGRTTSPLIEYIQDATPNLNWNMADPDSSDYQTDYELQVSDLPSFNNLLWDVNHTNRVTVYDAGTSDNARPWGTTQEMRFQFKWPTALFSETGLVDRLLFEVSAATGSVSYENLVISMVSTPVSGALTADFIANYGGETPVTVLNKQTYIAQVVDSQLVIDVENTFILNGQRDLIVEVRFTNCSSNIAQSQHSSADGGSVAYRYGVDAYEATTASFLAPRTHNMIIDFATDSVYSVLGSSGNWIPFGCDIDKDGIFQWKYNHSLVNREGRIDKLYFAVWGGTSWVTLENVTISLVETPVEGELTTDFDANYGGVVPTVVYQAEIATFYEVNGVLVVDVDDLFVYTKQHDLLIDMRFDATVSGQIALRYTSNVGGYRAFNVTWEGGFHSGTSAAAYDLSIDFVDSVTQVEYAGTPLTNSTAYYWRVRTCDTTGIWSDWASQYFKYETLSSVPEWETPVNVPDPATAGHSVAVSINVTYFLGISQVLIEYGGSNHTMTADEPTYSYTWSPTAAGTLNYTIYMESAIGTWSSVAGSFEVQAAPTLPIDTTMLLIIIGVVVVLGAVVCFVKRRK